MRGWDDAHHRQRRFVLGARYGRDRTPGSFLRQTASTTWILMWMLVFVSA